MCGCARVCRGTIIETWVMRVSERICGQRDVCFTFSEDWKFNLLSLSVLICRMGAIITSTYRLLGEFHQVVYIKG